jgi:hypothetical protein
MGQQGRKRVSLHVFDVRDQYDLPSKPSKRGIKLEPATVDEPGGDRKVLVFRQTRDDPLGEMHNRRHIDDVELLAGRQWQRNYETVHRGRVGCVLARPVVVQAARFGGGNIGDRQLDAARWLKRAEQKLGPELYQIVHDVCASGRSLRQIAAARGLTQWRVRKRFRDAIEKLTEFCGLATRKAT